MQSECVRVDLLCYSFLSTSLGVVTGSTDRIGSKTGAETPPGFAAYRTTLSIPMSPLLICLLLCVGEGGDEEKDFWTSSRSLLPMAQKWSWAFASAAV